MGFLKEDILLKPTGKVLLQVISDRLLLKPMKELNQKLAVIQTELKEKKSTYNPFGKLFGQNNDGEFEDDFLMGEEQKSNKRQNSLESVTSPKKQKLDLFPSPSGVGTRSTLNDSESGQNSASDFTTPNPAYVAPYELRDLFPTRLAGEDIAKFTFNYNTEKKGSNFDEANAFYESPK